MHFTSLFSMSSVLILLYYLIDMIRSYISPELKTFKNDEVWLSVIFNRHFDQIDAIFIKLFPYTQHTFMKTKKKTQEKNIARPIYICNLTIFISGNVRKICLILCLLPRHRCDRSTEDTYFFLAPDFTFIQGPYCSALN